MKFTAAAITAILPLAALSSPTKRAGAVSMSADVPQWTMQTFKRACDDADTSCTWSFGINANNGGAAAPCEFTVKALPDGTPASRAPQTDGVACGAYTVTSGWSGQFGEDNGFTTLSVVDWGNQLISWPSYSDKDLAGGKVVSPDRSFDVSKLS